MLEQAQPIIPPRKNLRSNCLSTLEVMAQSVGCVAPSTAPALILGAIFITAGNGLSISVLVALLGVALTAYSINIFAVRSASPGALYTFIGRALGPQWGLISGWAMIFSYILGMAMVAPMFADFLKPLVALGFHGELGLLFYLPVMAVMMAAMGFLAWRDIQLSTRLLLYVEFLSIAVFLVLAVCFFHHSGYWIDPDQLHLKGVTFDGLRQSFVLAFLIFLGFESAASFGAEARNPLQSIPRGIVASLLCVGLYCVISSYTLVVAFHGHQPPLDKADTPVNDLAIIAGIPWLGYIFASGLCVTTAGCFLACLNAAARVIFIMARHGVLHPSAGDAHAENETPHRAIVACIAIAAIVSGTMIWKGIPVVNIVDYLGTIAVFGYLTVYALISIAAPVYLRRRGEKYGLSLVMSALALFFLGIAFIGNVYPLPAEGVHHWLPFLFLGLMALGIAWIAWLRLRNRDVFAQIAAEIEVG